jgi:hypothetical protein
MPDDTVHSWGLHCSIPHINAHQEDHHNLKKKETTQGTLSLGLTYNTMVTKMELHQAKLPGLIPKKVATMAFK